MCGSQGICAEAMLRTITLIYNRLRQAGIPGGLVANVHDELLCWKWSKTMPRPLASIQTDDDRCVCGPKSASD